MKVKLEPKYSEIQRKLYQNHKLNGFDAGTKATNGLIDEVSKNDSRSIANDSTRRN